MFAQCKNEFWFHGDDMSEDIIIPEHIIDKFNSLGCTSFQMSAEEIKFMLERKEEQYE